MHEGCLVFFVLWFDGRLAGGAGAGARAVVGDVGVKDEDVVVEGFAVEAAVACPGAEGVEVDEEPAIEELDLEDGFGGDVVGGVGAEDGDVAFQLFDDVLVFFHGGYLPFMVVQPM